MNNLKTIVKKYQLFCFVTNEVRQNFNSGNDNKAAMGYLWEYMINTRIFLHRGKKFKESKELEERKIEVKFSSRFQICSEIKFNLKQEGLVGLSDIVSCNQSCFQDCMVLYIE